MSPLEGLPGTPCLSAAAGALAQIDLGIGGGGGRRLTLHQPQAESSEGAGGLGCRGSWPCGGGVLGRGAWDRFRTKSLGAISAGRATKRLCRQIPFSDAVVIQVTQLVTQVGGQDWPRALIGRDTCALVSDMQVLPANHSQRALSSGIPVDLRCANCCAPGQNVAFEESDGVKGSSKSAPR